MPTEVAIDYYKDYARLMTEASRIFASVGKGKKYYEKLGEANDAYLNYVYASRKTERAA